MKRILALLLVCLFPLSVLHAEPKVKKPAGKKATPAKKGGHAKKGSVPLQPLQPLTNYKQVGTFRLAGEMAYFTPAEKQEPKVSTVEFTGPNLIGLMKMLEAEKKAGNIPTTDLKKLDLRKMELTWQGRAGFDASRNHIFRPGRGEVTKWVRARIGGKIQ